MARNDAAIAALVGVLLMILAICISSDGYLGYADKLDAVLANARGTHRQDDQSNVSKVPYNARNTIGQMYGMALYSGATLLMAVVQLVIRIAPAVILTASVIAVGVSIDIALSR